MQRKAFTLWEVLAVIAVVCIGAAILLPPIFPMRARENARRSSCNSNLKQIGLSFAQYARDAAGQAPPVANARGGWMQLLSPYILYIERKEAIFQCPSTRDNKSGTTDYFFNAQLAGAKAKLGASAKPSFTILGGEGADDQPNSYNLSQLPAAWRKDESSPAWRHLETANYLFVDGHAKAMRTEKFFGPTDNSTPTFEVE